MSIIIKEICDICTEDFSTMHKNYRHKVCPYCQLTSCYKCIRTFLLSSSNIEPTCMGCRAVWGLDFISSITPTNFHNDEYRKYRARLLLEREKSLLPDTQNLVSVELEKRKRKILLIEMEKTIIQLKNQIWDIRKQIRTLTYGRIVVEDNIISKIFIKQCPVNECRGYLSSVWKCGICDIWVCSKCHIPKNGKEDIDHICDPGLIETAKLLQKETKACPSCSVPIYKIEGCDQMWCTQCKTPFSWKTGKIETGTVHNPHYYQWQRSQNNGVAPRVPGDIPNQECNILPRLRHLENKLSIYFSGNINEINIVFLVHRIVNHIREVELHRYPNNPVNIEDNSDLRVAYLLNELSEDKWKSELKKREKKREKNHEIHLVYNMAFLTLTDIIQRIYHSNTKEQINNIIKQLEPLREYINKNLLNIHNRFQNKVQYITSNWVFTNNINDL